MSESNIWVTVGLYLAVYTGCLTQLPKDNKVARGAAVGVLGLIALDMHFTTFKDVDDPFSRSTIAALISVSYLTLSEMMLITAVDAADLARLVKNDPNPGMVSQIWQALALVFNLRRVATPWQAKHVGKQTPQSKSQFISTTFAAALLGYLTLDLIETTPLPARQYMDVSQQTMQIWRLDFEESMVRLYVVMKFWISSYLWMSTTARVLGTFAVASGISDPESWPPLNGPLAASYTVRKFWSEFWHQCLRRFLTGFSDSVTDNILYIPRRTLASRYVRLFLAFFISAVVHHYIDVAMAIASSQAGAFQFFLSQAVAIMCEDYVQHLTASWKMSDSIRKAIGFVWVIFFFYLSTPVWFYPQLRLDSYVGFIPYSFFQMPVE